MNEKYLLYIVIGVVALIVIMLAAWLGHRAYLKKKARKERKARQYQQAEDFTKQVIEQQIEYANSLHAIDEMTIRAFEAMIEELANRRDRPSFMR